jgi:hypothetical protein
MKVVWILRLFANDLTLSLSGELVKSLKSFKPNYIQGSINHVKEGIKKKQQNGKSMERSEVKFLRTI